MGRPLASWPAQAAVWDKSWLESNFKIGAQRVNVLVSSMWEFLMLIYIYFHLYALQCKEEDKNTTVFSIILYLCCQWIILATLLIGIIELYNIFDTSTFIIIELRYQTNIRILYTMSALSRHLNQFHNFKLS